MLAIEQDILDLRTARVTKCNYQVTQEFVHGLLAGESVTLQILDQPGNSTAPLLSIADIAQLGAVMDLANSTISIMGSSTPEGPQDKDRFDNHSGDNVSM